MGITSKFDRAFQWAGEKMGQDAKTTVSGDFKTMEMEMALRHDGAERLHKSMNVYVKSLSRRGETFDDKEKGLPVSYLGRSMIGHGEDYEPDSEYGNCLIAMGRANERIAGLQESYVAHASSYWLEGLERSLAMMKEYQAARKKLENRRLAYDAASTKLQKAKREDFRLEDELRTSKAKYEESSEDVYRRVQDIKDSEAESIQDLTNFLDSELDHYERCAEELRRCRREWAAVQEQPVSSSYSRRDSEYGNLRRPTNRSRSNTARSMGEKNDRIERWASRQDIYEEEEKAITPAIRMPIRSSRVTNSGAATPVSPRPNINRASTYGGTLESSNRAALMTPSVREPPLPVETRKPSFVQNPGSLRANLRPVSRISMSDVFADDYDTATSSGSPEYDRSVSPDTSYGSLSRQTSNVALTGNGNGASKKAPPPPPPSRAKKPPPPPIPQKRTVSEY